MSELYEKEESWLLRKKFRTLYYLFFFNSELIKRKRTSMIIEFCISIFLGWTLEVEPQSTFFNVNSLLIVIMEDVKDLSTNMFPKSSALAS